MNRIRALSFDFDGLILDTETPAFHAWQAIYAEHGCDLSLAAWSACIGTSADAFDPVGDLESQLGKAVDRDAIQTQQQTRERELIDVQPVLPGVADYLIAAKRLGLKVGLASSSSRSWVTGHLSRLKLIQHFDCIQTADDVEFVKPDPALYHLVLDALGSQPNEVIAFEDSPNGILAAKRAGLFCVAVPNAVTRHLTFDHADLTVSSLAEVSLEQLLLDVAGI
jgi:HAD superfamily hydrolase (TIGR01509 family)